MKFNNIFDIIDFQHLKEKDLKKIKIYSNYLLKSNNENNKEFTYKIKFI